MTDKQKADVLSALRQCINDIEGGAVLSAEAYVEYEHGADSQRINYIVKTWRRILPKLKVREEFESFARQCTNRDGYVCGRLVKGKRGKKTEYEQCQQMLCPRLSEDLRYV